MNPFKFLILKFIRLYQKTLSFDHSFLKHTGVRVCRFTPSCSEYTYQSIDKYGIFMGTIKGSWRILRCNPFTKGGHDPVE